MKDSTKMSLWSAANAGGVLLNLFTFSPTVFSSLVMVLSAFTCGACACAAAVSYVEGK